MTFFVEHCRTKNAKYFCHPPFHPPIFCCHSLKLLSPTLPKLMNWILLSPPPLSSDPDTPPKFGTCTRWDIFQKRRFQGFYIWNFESHKSLGTKVFLNPLRQQPFRIFIILFVLMLFFPVNFPEQFEVCFYQKYLGSYKAL